MNRIPDAQQALQLLMRAPVAICLLSLPDYVIELANPHMLELWDRKPEAVGKKLTDVFTEVHQQGFFKILHHVSTTGQVVRENERETVIIRNGKRDLLYMNFVFQPHYADTGEIVGVLAVATEVTHQVLARNKIAQAEETSRLAVDAASLGSYEVNMETGEMTTSQRFNEIFGAVDAKQQRDFVAKIHPDFREIRIRAHATAIAEGNLEYEAQLINPSGEQWVKVTGRVLYDHRQKPMRLLGIVQDITEQKLASARLTVMIAERTKELEITNQQLSRSNAELEQFAFVTSHDLQEPLRKIQMFSSILLRKAEGQGGFQVYAEKISKAASRMTTLITDLLDYSRLSEGGPVPEIVNLNKIIANVQSDLELLIEQKNAAIYVDNLKPLPGIGPQLGQLFNNIIGNALKFSHPDRAPIITIRGELIENIDLQNMNGPITSGTYYKIIITDNGIGFDQQYADKIFVVFQRLTSTASYSGHGIGLAICHKIVTNHNGYIYASGTPGSGATFTIILPMKH